MKLDKERIRKLKGEITWGELASAANMTRPWLSTMLTHKRCTTEATADAIAEVLGVERTEILADVSLSLPQLLGRFAREAKEAKERMKECKVSAS
jgi:hypothetical protein